MLHKTSCMNTFLLKETCLSSNQEFESVFKFKDLLKFKLSLSYMFSQCKTLILLIMRNHCKHNF